MGDRFYQQQTGKTVGCLPSKGTSKMSTGTKPKRKLKADWVKDIQDRLDVDNLNGLIKTDLTTLQNLYEALDAEDI